ncbi:hypothetical protein C8R46DRAFT_1206598 [Mycena filopes]|nr:hypothetical protein C8R46DRAFT_1206598 [Mycena filopes]
MSPTKLSIRPKPTAQELAAKHRRHADAQARHRDKLELGHFASSGPNENAAVRQPAPQVGEEPSAEICSLRAARALSAEATERAAAQRQEVDADYRERCRKRKFIAKFGHSAFVRFYLPMHEKYGQRHLPGLKFLWETE